jgi:hypothetical protein
MGAQLRKAPGEMPKTPRNQAAAAGTAIAQPDLFGIRLKHVAAD